MEQQNELYHYGVLGMRWGFRRYQPYSLIPRKSGEGGKEVGAAKKASKSDGLKSTISKLQRKGTPLSEVKKSRKQKQEEVKSQKISDEKTARERKLKAAEVVKSGDAKLIYENRFNLTDAQLKTAINRIDTEKTLRGLVAEQNPSKIQKLSKAIEKVKPLVDTAETGIEAYNQVARVVNAFTGENETGRKNTLPYIGKAQNSYNKSGEISSSNRDFITKATKVTDLMNAAGKLNSAEAKLAVSKAESIEKLRKMADSEKDYNKSKAEAESNGSSSKTDNRSKQERLQYLDKSLSDIKKEKETYNEYVEKDAKLFNIPDKTSGWFDDYYELEVSGDSGNIAKEKRREKEASKRNKKRK